MAIFSLEAFQADHGDSLLIHYGDRKKPHFILIDGGPKSTTFSANTAARLNQLKDRFPTDDGKLCLDMVMVSHIDDDHIDGLLAMTGFLLECRDDQQPLPYEIRTCWFNSFDEILGNRDEQVFTGLVNHVQTAAVDGSFPEMDTNDQYGAAVVAGVNQGRRLRRDLTNLQIPLNAWPKQQPVDDVERMVVRPSAGRLTIPWDNHLKLTILAPDAKRLKRLHKTWDDAIKTRPTLKTLAQLAAYNDNSVANLSSIVVLAECGGKSMLLTGDARGDDVVAGAQAADLLQDETLPVDLLKLPHHGSDRNVTTDFFRKFPASHYVVSGNGEHGNPELVRTIEHMLEPARRTDDFTLHLTNRTGVHDFGHKVADYLKRKTKRNRDYAVNFRDDEQPSVIVNLLDPVDY